MIVHIRCSPNYVSTFQRENVTTIKIRGTLYFSQLQLAAATSKRIMTKKYVFLFLTHRNEKQAKTKKIPKSMCKYKKVHE